eukprot:757759-Pelagomonas_calceolata.AAC.2
MLAIEVPNEINLTDVEFICNHSATLHHTLPISLDTVSHSLLAKLATNPTCNKESRGQQQEGRGFSQESLMLTEIMKL